MHKITSPLLLKYYILINLNIKSYKTSILDILTFFRMVQICNHIIWIICSLIVWEGDFIH